MHTLHENNLRPIEETADLEVPKSTTVRGRMTGGRPKFTTVAQADVDNLMSRRDMHTSKFQNLPDDSLPRRIQRPNGIAHMQVLYRGSTKRRVDQRSQDR